MQIFEAAAQFGKENQCNQLFTYPYSMALGYYLEHYSTSTKHRSKAAAAPLRTKCAGSCLSLFFGGQLPLSLYSVLISSYSSIKASGYLISMTHLLRGSCLDFLFSGQLPTCKSVLQRYSVPLGAVKYHQWDIFY